MKSDRQIQKDIMDEFDFDPGLSTEKIGVSVTDGVVTLTGQVPSYAQKYAAERACFRVHGVKAVAEDITVSLPGSSERSDTDMAQAAADTLAWHVIVPSSVQVSVENGQVILRGLVDWGYQRKAAEKALRNLMGIKGITNHIKVQSRIQPKDVKDKIGLALQRLANEKAKNIHVEVIGGKVILTGTVNSLAEKNDIEWAAWASGGVNEVEDHLRVRS